MPKARKKKTTEFDNAPVKSVFLYGNPNKGKLAVLWQMERKYVELINFNVEALMNIPDIYLQLIKNDKKDPYIRLLQKQLRPKDINSAFCQNAFDSAFTKLSNRLDSIRLEMLKTTDSIFCKSKVLFGLSLNHASKDEMIAFMRELIRVSKKIDSFYQECLSALSDMSDAEFDIQMFELFDLYDMTSAQYKVPYVKSEAIPFDSRMMRIEKSESTEMPYVITLTNPFEKGKRFAVPVNTSKHSLHKISCNDMDSTITVKPQGTKLRVGWSYSKKLKEPKTDKTIGVDTGIKDAFFLSDGIAVGTMRNVIDFYHSEVEPAFAQISCLRNKKRSISYYVRHHSNLPEDVRRSLISKMDRLEQMIRTAKAPYRKKRAYYNMLNHEIRLDVEQYISCISRDTLTVLELLDIKEFEKSRKLNGDLSTFARGQLQHKLMEELNWYGYSYVEVPPDYTSQTCPVCSCCSSLNRSKTDSKKFRCTCCGYEDDADHVGAINIRNRATDTELLAICSSAKNHKALQSGVKKLLDSRNIDWINKSLTTPILQEPEKVISLS